MVSSSSSPSLKPVLHYKLEICCYNIESAILAAQAGADRIELCDNYYEGGTTPSLGTIELVLERLVAAAELFPSPPELHVMIRPRGGDFLYTETEYEVMKRDVKFIKNLRQQQHQQQHQLEQSIDDAAGNSSTRHILRGIVIGFLNAEGTIDTKRTKEIVELARPDLDVTFHRAFDMCIDPFVALDELNSCGGITRILTSGRQAKAYEGRDLIGQLVEKAEGTRRGQDDDDNNNNNNDCIAIMPGSGINESNLQQLMIETKAREFHASTKCFQASKMNYTNPNIHSMGGGGQQQNSNPEEYQTITVNPTSIRRMKEILLNHAEQQQQQLQGST